MVDKSSLPALDCSDLILDYGHPLFCLCLKVGKHSHQLSRLVPRPEIIRPSLGVRRDLAILPGRLVESSAVLQRLSNRV